MNAVEQRTAALESANRIRLGRAALRREIRDGELLVVDALDDPRSQSMSTFDLLQCQRGWGSNGRSAANEGKRSMRLLESLEISPYRKVGELTLRQKALIMDVLEPVEQAA